MEHKPHSIARDALERLYVNVRAEYPFSVRDMEIVKDELDRLYEQLESSEQKREKLSVLIIDQEQLYVKERKEARSILREWCEYTGLRGRIRESDDPTEYETGRDLLARTDAFVGNEMDAVDAIVRKLTVTKTVNDFAIIEQLVEQLQSAERQRDLLQREADMYKADRDEYDALLGRKMAERDGLLEQLEAQHKTLEDIAKFALSHSARDGYDVVLSALYRCGEEAGQAVSSPASEPSDG